MILFNSLKENSGKYSCSVCKVTGKAEYYLFLSNDIVGLDTRVYLCKACAKQFKYEVNSAMEVKK